MVIQYRFYLWTGCVVCMLQFILNSSSRHNTVVSEVRWSLQTGNREQMFGCTHYQIWLYYSLNEVRNQMKWRTLIVTILQFL